MVIHNKQNVWSNSNLNTNKTYTYLSPIFRSSHRNVFFLITNGLEIRLFTAQEPIVNVELTGYLLDGLDRYVILCRHDLFPYTIY